MENEASGGAADRMAAALRSKEAEEKMAAQIRHALDVTVERIGFDVLLSKLGDAHRAEVRREVERAVEATDARLQRSAALGMEVEFLLAKAINERGLTCTLPFPNIDLPGMPEHVPTCPRCRAEQLLRAHRLNPETRRPLPYGPPTNHPVFTVDGFVALGKALQDIGTELRRAGRL